VRWMMIVLLASCVGCGLKGPVPVAKRKDVLLLAEQNKTSMPFKVAVLPAVVSDAESQERTHKHSYIASLEADECRDAVVSTLQEFKVFADSVAADGAYGPDALKEAKKRKIDLVIVPKVKRAEVYYAGTSSWYTPNLFIWFFLDAASWFVADERYGLEMEGSLDFYSVYTNNRLKSVDFSVKSEGDLDDFQRGWKIWGILRVPSSLGKDNWKKVTGVLKPHLLEQIKGKVLEIVWTQFGPFSKSKEFLAAFKPAETVEPPKPKEKPKAAFVFEPSGGAAPLKVRFTDKSTGEISRWEWDFDSDGKTDSDKRNPSHVFEKPGSYAVTLKVTGPGGSDSVKREGCVKVSAPVAVEPPKPKPTKPTLQAVLVGVEDYASKGIRRAAFAHEDLSAVERRVKALSAYKVNVVVLRGAKATKAALQQALSKVPECDLFVFYFSGAGATEPVKKNPKQVLLLYDADRNEMGKTGLSLAELADALGKVKCKRGLAVIDAGFNNSGGGRTVVPGETKVHLPVEFPALSKCKIGVLLACTSGQTAGYSRIVRHGFLTHYLLKSLAPGVRADSDKDGVLTAEELHRYLRKQVSEQTGGQQTPLLMGDSADVRVLLKKREKQP